MKIDKRHTRFLLNILLFIVGVFFVIIVLPRLLILFLPFVIGGIIALAVNPLVRILETKLKVKRKIGALLGILFTLFIGGGLIYLTISRIVYEVQGLIKISPEILSTAFIQVSDLLSGLYAQIPENWQGIINQSVESIQNESLKHLQSIGMPTLQFAGNFAKGLPQAFIFTIVMILSAYFISVEKETIISAIGKVIPDKIKEKFSIVIKDLRNALGGYVKAQLTIMVFIFIIIFTGFTIIGVDYKLVLAMMISLFDALPFFGSGAVLIPWALISFINGQSHIGIGMAIIYLVVLVTRQLLEPKIIGKNIGLHPLATLMGMYIGLRLFGVIGIILGAPSIIIVKNLYKAGLFDGIIDAIKSFFQWLNPKQDSTDKA